MKVVTNDFAQTHLAERLISSLEAKVSAGREAGPIHSAALIISDKLPFYLVDL
jgi:uncharacterized Ntn-hydrolase superfamily protein